MKTAYVNAIGGASGDMLLASLVDSGLDLVGLSSALASVGVAVSYTHLTLPTKA